MKVLDRLQIKAHALSERIARLVWNETWHPRAPAGTGRGGEFTPKGSNTMVEIREQIKNWERAKEKLQTRIANAMSKPADPVFGRSDVFRYKIDIERIDMLIKAKREELSRHVTDTAGPAGDVLLPGEKAVRRWRLPRTRVLAQEKDRGVKNHG